MNYTDMNFFIDVDGARALLAKEYRRVSRSDIQFTVDWINGPYRLIFTQDPYVHMVKRVLRFELGFLKKDSSGSMMNGFMVVEKDSGKVHNVAPNEDAEKDMELFFQICMRIMMCVEDYKLDEVAQTMDMQKEGFIIFDDDGELAIGRLSGKGRPKMAYIGLSDNKVTVGRPYWDEEQEEWIAGEEE